MTLLKASSNSNPNSLAGAIVASLRESNYVEVQSIGAGAVNQTMKAVAIGRGFLAPSGSDLVCFPAFEDITINDEKRTAMKVVVKKINIINN